VSRALRTPERRRHPVAAGRLLILGLLALGAVALGLAPDARAQQAVPREAIEEIVRDYLLRHPEVILEALQRAEQQQREAARRQTRETIVARRPELLQDAESPVGGNPTGDVTVVEFFDYRCPHCKRMAPVVKALLASDPGVRLVYKELPILGEESLVAARGALAAAMQGRYVDAHDRLMSEAGPLTAARVVSLLAALGLDEARLRADMDSPDLAGRFRRILALAQALGVDGTPAFVVGGELVVGAVDLETLRGLVTRARQAPQP